MQQTGQHQTFYEEIKCFINFLKAISSILEKLLLYSREKIEIFSCQNSNKLPTIMFIRQGDNFKTISFIFQTRDNRKLPPSALLEFLDLRNCWTRLEFQLCNKFWKIVGILFWARVPWQVKQWNIEFPLSFKRKHQFFTIAVPYEVSGIILWISSSASACMFSMTFTTNIVRIDWVPY